MTDPRRVVMIGLDCATPQLMFDRYAEDMPVLTSPRDSAIWGPLQSIIPPITMPAWACMMSGRTPGDLGVYGFRDRRRYDYGPLAFATSRDIAVPRIWDVLSAAGKRSVVLSVPGTYPPTSLNGCMVSCFLTPSTDVEFTYPPSLREDIMRLTGGYTLDVENFRSPDLARVGQQIFDMTEQRFKVARHMMTSQAWDFFTFVDMGPDRLHHGFWKYCDPDHPRHEPGNEYRNIFRQYYQALDQHIAGLLEDVPGDAAVLIVSDHGAQPMLGGFCINEWLRAEGLLVLAEEPAGPVAVSAAKVDWSHTVAWAEGGYYSRLYINVAGREPQGIVPEREYDTVLDELVTALESLPDLDGRPMGTRAMRPRDVYPETHGIAPDLIVYLGNLRWRALGTLGLGQGLYTTENDTGPDHANHAEQGLFLLYGSDRPHGYREGMSIYDVAPTLHELLGLAAQPGQRGFVIS